MACIKLRQNGGDALDHEGQALAGRAVRAVHVAHAEVRKQIRSGKRWKRERWARFLNKHCAQRTLHREPQEANQAMLCEEVLLGKHGGALAGELYTSGAWKRLDERREVLLSRRASSGGQGNVSLILS